MVSLRRGSDRKYPGSKEAHMQTFHNHSSREIEGDQMETGGINYAVIEELLNEFMFYCPQYNPDITKIKEEDTCCRYAANCVLKLMNQSNPTGDTNLVTNVDSLYELCSGKTCRVGQSLTNLINYVNLMKEESPEKFESIEDNAFKPFNTTSDLLDPKFAEIMTALTSNTEVRMDENPIPEAPSDRKPYPQMDMFG